MAPLVEFDPQTADNLFAAHDLRLNLNLKKLPNHTDKINNYVMIIYLTFKRKQNFFSGELRIVASHDFISMSQTYFANYNLLFGSTIRKKCIIKVDNSHDNKNTIIIMTILMLTHNLTAQHH